MKDHEGHRIIEVAPDGEIHDGLKLCSDCGVIEARVLAGGRVVVDVMKLTRELAETLSRSGQTLKEGVRAFDNLREAFTNPLVRAVFPKTYAALAGEIQERTVERDPPEFVRASGDAICGVCLKPYRKHPLAAEPECLGSDGPFLRRLCGGTLVKL